MQKIVNTTNIETFACDVTVDLLNRTFKFDFSNSVFTNSPAGFDVALAVSVVDSGGLSLAEIDFNNPQIPDASVTTEYDLDLSMSVDWNFLFQKYKIKVAAKDDTDVVYLEFPVKEVCQPKGFTDEGYVGGEMMLISDCNNDSLTVKELTVFSYQDKEPLSKSTDGTLYYPQGTKADVNFSFTPFSDTNIYTGYYKIDNTTTATYDLSDGFFVNIAYATVFSKELTCTKAMEELLCCITDYKAVMSKHCGDAIGDSMQEKWNKASLSFFTGWLKETVGQDASKEAKEVREILNCKCTNKGIKKVQKNTPLNQIITIAQAGGTTVTSSVVGNTKQYTIASKTYSLAKGNPLDLAFDVTQSNTSQYGVQNTLTFYYDKIAEYVYTATSNSDELLAQLNALIQSSGIDLSNVDGKCIIDLSSSNYFLTKSFPSNSATIKSIKINNVVHTATSPIVISNESSIESWLNGLSLGTFIVGYSVNDNKYYSNILSVDNANTLNEVVYSLNGTDVTVTFQKTNKSVVALFQALINYMCELDAGKVVLGGALPVYTIDGNGNLVTTTYPSETSTFTYLDALAAASLDMTNRVRNATTLTCNTIKALFPSSSSVMQATDYVIGTKGGLCARIPIVELGTRIFENGIYNQDFVNSVCNVVSVCGSGKICEPFTNLGVATLEHSPMDDDFDIEVTFAHQSAATVDITYARIDNTNTPIYTTINGVTIGSSPYLITVPKGQYNVGVKPVYADGRLCSYVYKQTAACGSVLSFNGSAVKDGSDYYFDATYTVTSDKFKITINAPNGGIISQLFNNGDTVHMLLPTGVDGVYSAVIQCVCNENTGWLSVPSAPIIFNKEEFGDVTVTLTPSFSAQVDGINGVIGFSLIGSVVQPAVITGRHYELTSATIGFSISGTTTPNDGVDIHVNGSLLLRKSFIETASPQFYTVSGINVAANDSLQFEFNNVA